MKTLTANQVKALSKPGVYRVDRTLYFWIKDTGRRYWIQKVVIDGKRSTHSLGVYPGTSYKEATNQARKNKEQIQDYGKNPFAKEYKDALTFEQAASQYHAFRLTDWTPTHAKNWLGEVKRHVLPVIGQKRVSEITQEDVIRVLKPIREKRATDRRVRGRVKEVMGYCKHTLKVLNNLDAVENIDKAYQSKKDNTEHRAALPSQEVPECVQAIERLESENSKLALLWTIHTASRQKETRFATWEEIDKNARLWTVSKESMGKSGEEHRVPLSDAALAILDRAAALGGRKGFIFPSAKHPREAMSNGTLAKALREAGYSRDRVTPHGFRNSFGDWGITHGYDKDLVECALSHTEGRTKTQKAYIREDRLEERVDMMQAWSDHVTGS